MDNFLENTDLYILLGITQTSSIKEVKKAYRKKALTCHPDKNPDNPRAGELFHQLSQALEVLTDELARAAYDNVLNAKRAAKLRRQSLNSRFKKLRDDLEAREKKAEEAEKCNKHTNIGPRTCEEILKAEIERLRKEGSREVEAEVELVNQQVLKEHLNPQFTTSPHEGLSCRLKVQWKLTKDDPENSGYSRKELLDIFSKYGDIVALVVSSKKNGSALVEFNNQQAAEMAHQLERGLTNKPITVKWLGESTHSSTSLPDKKIGAMFPVGNEPGGSDSTFPSFSFNSSNVERPTKMPMENRDFENLVLHRMRQAEERRKLAQQIKNEEG